MELFFVQFLMLLNAVIVRFLLQPGGVLVEADSVSRFHFDYGDMLSAIKWMIVSHVVFLFLNIVSHGGGLVSDRPLFDGIILWTTRCGYVVWFLMLLLLMRSFTLAFPW
jgi:hypothetical protein